MPIRKAFRIYLLIRICYRIDRRVQMKVFRVRMGPVEGLEVPIAEWEDKVSDPLAVVSPPEAFDKLHFFKGIARIDSISSTRCNHGFFLSN